VDNPYYTSIIQRREEQVRDARRKDGLTEEPTDVKESHQKVPGLTYNYTPAAPSKTLLEANRKEEMQN